jgi:hypothetical protein
MPKSSARSRVVLREAEWMLGTIHRPCKTTVYNHFGTWSAALAAAWLNK